MNLQEAYSVLDLPASASPEEAKKQYRKLTKEFHPDINKAPDATDKFKKINEAYQCVQNGKGNDPENIPPMRNPFGGFGGFNDFNAQAQRAINLEPISLETTVSFKESVLGCKRDLTFNRKIKCPECDGKGMVQLNNGCTKCGGKGQVIGKQGMMIFVQTCDKCKGKVQTKTCDKCNGDSILDADTSVQVSVPGGIEDDNILRLHGMGHYMGSFMGMSDQYSDVFLKINVTQEPGLSLQNDDVIFNLNISLLDALQGCSKSVNTIMGEKEIDIPPKSKNKEEIILPKLGVNEVGNQRIILNVDYPQDISIIINALTTKEKEI